MNRETQRMVWDRDRNKGGERRLTVDLIGEKMDWSPPRLDSSFRFLSNLFSSYSNKN
jgi:hypothetical protein